jgi:phosphomannomutase
VNDASANSLRSRLTYDPVPLKFGTSGRRGLVIHLTQLEIYINALAELEYLQQLPRAEGGVTRGDEFYFACDLRPSSDTFSPEDQGRGELAQAVSRAIGDAGLKPVFLGWIPTPALANFSFSRGRGSFMVTGSHIPFDRNGYKINTAKGELLKKDEAPIQQQVERVRARIYSQSFAQSLFNERGMFKTDHQHLPNASLAGQAAYLRRYTDFFAGRSLAGKRLLVYEHSAVGRDLLVQILQPFGAEVIPAGRSDTFVPIDTENIDEAQLAVIRSLVEEAWRRHGPIDAVVSTDGDSDRPLVLGVEPSAGPAACQVTFYGGDLLGMVVAEFLGADAVIVPISCNDAVDRGPLKDVGEPKTRIGSPFVIAGMQRALAKGRKAVCGWEANGGFLTGSDFHYHGKVLSALPTRDAVLPILGVLFRAAELGLTLSKLFDRLPRRFSRAALLKQFPREQSHRILDRYSPAEARVKEVSLSANGPLAFDEHGSEVALTPAARASLAAVQPALEQVFNAAAGFSSIERINYLDGIRMYFTNGDIAHVRPSGNADELRIYAVADTTERADTITRLAVAEPCGLLRQLASTVSTS